MARERFIKSDLDEGQGVEGKRPHNTRASVDAVSGSPITPEDRSAPDERGQDTEPKAKAKKGTSFDRLSIKESNDANIFR